MGVLRQVPWGASWGQMSARLIADSVNPAGVRLSTFECLIPRFILAEANTHRMLSRNAESSRYVGAARMRQSTTFVPLFPAERKGMKTEELLAASSDAEKVWLESASKAQQAASALTGVGVHHSISNRILEPFRLVKWLVSFTESRNFLLLRLSPEAEVHFRIVAALIATCLKQHEPVKAKLGDWHLPYLLDSELEVASEKLVKRSVARCARVSAGTIGAGPEADELLYDRLLENRHMSPFEHAARAECDRLFGDSNFRGWEQHRKMLDGENQEGAFSSDDISDQVVETIIPGWREMR